MDDEAYRALLARIAGVGSAAALSIDGRGQVLKEMERLGWKAKTGKRRSPAAQAQAGKIRALWLELHRAGRVRDVSERALSRWVKRMAGVDDVERLERAEAQRVIEALKQWLERPAQGA